MDLRYDQSVTYPPQQNKLWRRMPFALLIDRDTNPKSQFTAIGGRIPEQLKGEGDGAKGKGL